jgi:hypothetical protein
VTQMDDEEKLERFMRSTWQCTKCGGRHRFSENVCPVPQNHQDQERR